MGGTTSPFLWGDKRWHWEGGNLGKEGVAHGALSTLQLRVRSGWRMGIWSGVGGGSPLLIGCTSVRASTRLGPRGPEPEALSSLLFLWPGRAGPPTPSGTVGQGWQRPGLATGGCVAVERSLRGQGWLQSGLRLYHLLVCEGSCKTPLLASERQVHQDAGPRQVQIFECLQPLFMG